MYKILCLICQKEFETPDKRRKYCSIQCANLKNQERRSNYGASKIVGRECLNCKKEFFSRDKRAKFCGMACAAHYNNILRGKKTEDEKKKISESMKAYHSSNEMSQETKDKIRISLIEYNINSPKGAKVKICKQCNSVFYPDKVFRYYCSYECYNKSRNAQSKNEISYRTFIKILKRAFPEWKCPFCDWNHNFEVHHINGRTDNNFNSLVMLCPSHHSLAHLGKIDCEEMKRHAIGSKLSQDELMGFYHGRSKTLSVNFYKYKTGKEAAIKVINDRKMVNLDSGYTMLGAGI